MDCPVNPLHYHGSGDYYDRKQNAAMSNGPDTEAEFREFARKQFTTPQPHFVPRYTGYVPGSRCHSTGQTYGQYTSNLLRNHRVAGNRLSRIPGDCYIPMDHPSTIPYDNPHMTLEPHFVPGYTGFTPGSGIKRSEGFGETYGKMTHVRLAKHFLRGGRLRPIYEYPAEYIAREEDAKFYNYEHELTRDDIKRRSRVLPGYTGHIPRAIYRHGKSSANIADESIAEFQKILNKNK